MAKTPDLSFENLTLGEIAQLEELSGQSMNEWRDDNAPKAKFLTALAFIMKRREDASYTFSQAEMLTLEELSEITGGDATGEADAA